MIKYAETMIPAGMPASLQIALGFNPLGETTRIISGEPKNIRESVKRFIRPFDRADNLLHKLGI